jgi:hypothetical protein
MEKRAMAKCTGLETATLYGLKEGVMVPKGWIEITQLDGHKLVASVQQIVCIRRPTANEFAPAAQSVVDFTKGRSQGAIETFDVISERIDKSLT